MWLKLNTTGWAKKQAFLKQAFLPSVLLHVRERTNVTESIIEEIRRRRLSWFGHLSRMEIDRLPARALYCHVTGERSQGRQAKKWIENIKEDFELRNIQFKRCRSQLQRQNCTETTNIINLIVIVMTDEKRRKKKTAAWSTTGMTLSSVCPSFRLSIWRNVLWLNDTFYRKSVWRGE